MPAAHPLTAQDAETLERCMQVGGVAVVPTDTVYGLACDPDDPEAFRRLWGLKRRDPNKPSAVLFSRVELAIAATPWLDEVTSEALGRLLPGPVTAVIANPERRFQIACGNAPERLGIRVPRWPEPAEALSGLSWPILQSSANLSGGPDIARIADLDETLREDADLILDAGDLPGTASTVVDLSGYAADGSWRVLREGAVDQRALARLLDL
ncbi:MAG: Sua5/YciO/YrdC/YwlC family protein [Solirubrobacteraceae bacterium]|nr:Sua5/YciO/YrdC/YwlC family protein [Solirubrobacteraceae bacterium]